MAHTSTARRRFGVAISTLGVGVAAAAALVGLAGTASAHTPDIKAECTEGGTVLSVDLKAYNDKGTNTVTIKDNDKVLLAETAFASTFQQTFDKLDATVTHDFVVDVKAWDDPNGTQGFTKTLTAKAEACVVAPPEETTTTTPPPVESSTEAPPAPSSAAPTTTTTPVEKAALAETGASIALPLGIGAVLLVGGGVLLFIVRRRGRA
ncbi:hypothetical protein [Actinophytocola sp.]|jgi:cell division septation protein DedD|uniref:hypothetical protein n=1 Tax=Actinophytocola sp. TaxID=1872138 RepID=UPI002ED99E73